MSVIAIPEGTDHVNAFDVRGFSPCADAVQRGKGCGFAGPGSGGQNVTRRLFERGAVFQRAHFQRGDGSIVKISDEDLAHAAFPASQ